MPVDSQDNSKEATLDDRVLLRRFVQDADEAAFAEIVSRYQKLVMSVCGRILGYGPDADDAFQATFVCLARRPRSIRSSKALSSWLYTVAYRTSWRLVRSRNRTSTESLEAEEPMSQTVDPLHEISDAQDCAIVDEELNHLPAKHRDVLVMTYFANQTSQQIADALNVSKGTIDGRLRDARNSLRVKLARRGVSIGAVALAATACSEASAAVSPTLLNSTLQLGTQALANPSVVTPDLSRIHHLIRPETTMISTKLIAATILGIASVGALGFTGIVLAQQDDAANAAAATLSGSLDARAGEATQTGKGEGVDVAVDQLGETKKAAAKSPKRAYEDLLPPMAYEAATDDAANPVGDPEPRAASADLFDDLGPPETSATTPGKTNRPAYSAIPQDASVIEKQIYEALEKQTVKLIFPSETPLPDVLDEMTKALNEYDSSTSNISVVVDHQALDNEGISSMNDVIVRDIELSNIPLQKAMKLILEQTEVDYLIRDDVLFITTKGYATENQDYYSTRIYPVGHLLDLDVKTGEYNPGAFSGGGLQSLPTQLGGGGLGGGGGLVSPRLDHPLIGLIKSMTTPPCNWGDIDPDAAGAISLAGNSLVVRQSRRGHEEIVKLLNLLTNAENTPAK